MEFTESELEELAEHICGRVDALNEIIAHGRSMPNKSSLQNDIRALKSLDEKLRPYFKNRT